MAKRLQAAERRASILAVAKVLFADKGYHGVSVDEIAVRLAVSPAVLYRHFPSKLDLYESVLSAIACKRENYVDIVVRGPDDFAGLLQRMTLMYVQSVARDPDYLRMELHAALAGSQAAYQFFENRWRPFADYIEYGLGELRREGRVPAVDARVAALLFQGMVREALYAKIVHQADRYRSYSLEDLVRQLVILFLQAVRVA
ncbi:MAG: helix-turn-helix domain-containing protein [Thiogranum sp.]|nr:helix-turn-helix domain-containing protein [Thiogranum sp.]